MLARVQSVHSVDSVHSLDSVRDPSPSPSAARRGAPKGHALVSRVFQDHHADLKAYLRARFPRVCEGRIEDAVGDACVDLLRQGADVERSFEEGGEARVLSLARVVAWRKVRGGLRRAHMRSELGVDDLSTIRRANPAGQLVGVALADFSRAIDRAVPASGTTPSQLPAVRQALEDKLETHDSDGAVAARHGIRREHLNRAKRALMNELSGLV